MDATTISTANDPLLALVVSLLTPRGAGWLVTLVVLGFYLFKSGRAKRFLQWVGGMFRTVDTLSRVDESLGLLKGEMQKVDGRITAHLADADKRDTVYSSGIAAVSARVDETRGDMREIRSRLDEVVLLSREVRHEVKNNGGSSVKDSTHRIERALGLPEPTEQGIPAAPVVSFTGPVAVTPTAPTPTL